MNYKKKSYKEQFSTLYEDNEYKNFKNFVEEIAEQKQYKILIPQSSQLNKETEDGNFVVLKDNEQNLHLLLNDSNADSIGYCFINSSDPYVKAYGWDWFTDLEELINLLS